MARYLRILSIDGGGIRGIIPGQVLVTIEKKIQKHTGNSNARIADYFDLIAGTSTGGILACAHLCPENSNRNEPKFTAKQVLDLYEKNGKEIFHTPFLKKLIPFRTYFTNKYPPRNIEPLLKQYFEDIKLSQLLKPCLITAYDTRRANIFFFRHQDALVNQARDFYLRDVALATSAAPTYFEQAHIYSQNGIMYPLVDGGVVANNPTMTAYLQAQMTFMGFGKRIVKTSDMVVLSLGTGNVRTNYPRSKKQGQVAWAKPVIDIMMTGMYDITNFTMRKLFWNCPNQYLRIEVDLSKNTNVNIEMDDASKKNIEELMETGSKLAQKFDKELDSIIELLCNDANDDTRYTW